MTVSFDWRSVEKGLFLITAISIIICVLLLTIINTDSNFAVFQLLFYWCSTDKELTDWLYHVAHRLIMAGKRVLVATFVRLSYRDRDFFQRSLVSRNFLAIIINIFLLSLFDSSSLSLWQRVCYVLHRYCNRVSEFARLILKTQSYV